ncbi:hypothetical protein F511_09204 [Dorcoceras hygrometricum]|uniref:Uncharacterized protein n=1 Tax=Dorcoceras hygrometricum TaxID=472368 RepID=A0A2Z7AV21_9LAMI|nr:hypothetical protein F511_09204 [Dorcoceras hygrometricum]
MRAHPINWSPDQHLIEEMDLTQVRTPSVPAAGTEATNAQDAVQKDFAQTDVLVHRPTSDALDASASHQLVSRPASDRRDGSNSSPESQSRQLESEAQARNVNHQLMSDDPVATIQLDILMEQGTNPI